MTPETPEQNVREVDEAAALVALKERLLADSAPTLTIPCPIERIVVDQRFQIRDALDAGAVHAYRRRYLVGAFMPPIKVADVAGVYYLIDGYHRLEALRQLDQTVAQTEIIPMSTIEDAMWLGGEINSAHGVKLTKEEREKRFRLYLKMGKHFVPGKPKTIRWVKSYRMIGQEFGVTHPTVEKWVRIADKKLWQDLAFRGQGQIERAGGGLRHSMKIKPEDILKRNLNNVRASFVGITDPAIRGEVIAKLEAITAELKTGAAWTPFMAPDTSTTDEF